MVFQPWARELPSDIELWAARLPGRESRFGQAPMTEAAQIVEALADAVAAAPRVPTLAIYGHSMGAILGFELAHALRARGIMPDLLMVSGRAAPHRHEGQPRVHLLGDEEFLQNLLALYGGIPQAILDDRELLNLFLPTLRADLQVVETYRFRERPGGEWPLMVYGGIDDQSVGREDLLEWQHHTSGPFRLQMMAGGHFFVQTERAAFLEALLGDVRTWCRP